MSTTLDAPTRQRLPSQQQAVAHAYNPAPTPSGRIQRWTAVQTYPQAERWTQTNLQQRGYHTYLPLYAAHVPDRLIRSSRLLLLRPLFPRYLFVELSTDDPWTPIRYSPGVYKLLMNDGKVVYARKGAVEALREGDAQRATPALENARWAPGAAVAVANGMFQGVPAVVLSVGKDMALIAMLMLGQLREVAVDLSNLAPREN